MHKNQGKVEKCAVAVAKIVLCNRDFFSIEYRQSNSKSIQKQKSIFLSNARSKKQRLNHIIARQLAAKLAA